MSRQCNFSGKEVAARIDTSLPVECPECGAIRTIPRRHVWSDMFTYPSHTQVNFVRPRRRNARVNGVWKIVEAG